MNDKSREAIALNLASKCLNEKQYKSLTYEKIKDGIECDYATTELLAFVQAAINSTTATSGEAESIAVVIDCDMVGTPYVRFNKKVPLGTKLYAIPPDQSARIAELVLALQKFIDNSSIQTNYPTECEFAEQALAKIKDK